MLCHSSEFAITLRLYLLDNAEELMIYRPAKQKASKVFVCPSYPTCDYKAVSMKDVFRHARSKKHRYELEDTPFRCEEQGCKSATSGFPRRDNWLRHMSTVHGIQAPRQKPGRKRLNRRVDEAV
ncbi:hypothetical protein F5Y08DRAFT_321983, partial [Xylaria arbuscula]